MVNCFNKKNWGLDQTPSIVNNTTLTFAMQSLGQFKDNGTLWQSYNHMQRDALFIRNAIQNEKNEEKHIAPLLQMVKNFKYVHRSENKFMAWLLDYHATDLELLVIKTFWEFFSYDAIKTSAS